MSESSLKITVKLFAAFQEAYGTSEITLNLSPQTSVKDVLNIFLRDHPELEKWREITRFGVNLQFVDPQTLLQDGDEVVFIPPVSGG